MTETTILDKPAPGNISIDLAEAIADLLDDYEIASPYSVDYALPVGPNGQFVKAYWRIPYDFENLPDRWTVDVSRVIATRMAMRQNKAYHDGVDALEGPFLSMGMVTYLHDQHGKDGWAPVEKRPLGYLRELYLKGTMLESGESIAPNLGDMPVLRLDHGVFFNRRHDSWANYASYMVPVDHSPVANCEGLRDALRSFADALRTTNGYSGYGSSWECSMDGSGEFVVLTSRSSMPE